MEQTKKASPRTSIKKGLSSRVFDGVNVVLLLLLSITTIYPFWDTLVVSVSSLKSYLSSGVHLWPQEWSFEGYKYMVLNKELWTSYGNSIFITVVGTIINMLITTMAAYVLSKKNLKGQRVIMFGRVEKCIKVIPQYVIIGEKGKGETSDESRAV